MSKSNNKQGFTLIELLVVIAIIGLLSTLSILALNSARARARDTKRITDVRQMQQALEMYYNEFNAYPSAAVAGSSIGSTTVYMKTIPTPPTPLDYSSGNCASGTTQPNYTYVQQSSGASYTIQYCLGSAVAGITAGENKANPAGMQ